MNPTRQILLCCAMACSVSPAIHFAQGRHFHNPTGCTAIVNVTVFDARTTGSQSGITVVIKGSFITTVGSATKVHVPEACRVIDGRERFLIPGLWDMHVHLALAGESALPMFLAYGVTSVRDMGGDPTVLKSFKAAIQLGSTVGPRIRFAGPPLESATWLARVQRIRLPGFAFPNPAWRLDPAIGVSDQQSAFRAVDSLAHLGVDFVKVRTIESRGAFLAIARAARLHHLRLVGHSAVGVVSLRDASNAGQRSFEHADFASELRPLSDTQREAEFELFVHNHTWFDPTLVSDTVDLIPESVMDNALRSESSSKRRGSVVDLHYLSPFMLESFRRDLFVRSRGAHAMEDRDWTAICEELRAMHAAGVRLLIGTDLGALWVFPGSSVHDELALFVHELGLTPGQALRIATHDAADFSGQLSTLGTIEQGKLADLVLLNADPLVNIANTRRITAVITDGRYLSSPTLDSLTAAVRFDDSAHEK